MFDSFLNSTLGFLLNWNPVVAITVVSLVISLIIVLAYKFMTNQEEMKRLKDETKSFQKQMKELKSEPEKMMQVQKKAMEVNLIYMRKSMTPTLVTFLPIILIFGWLNGHFAYEALQPGQEFTLTAFMEKNVIGNVTITAPEGLEVVGDKTAVITDREARFTLKGAAGEYYATLESNGGKADKHIIISEGKDYASVTESFKSDVFKSATLGNEKRKILFGLTWIWVYLATAIAFSILFRKVLRVH